jgi:hypothetical protein
MDSDERAPARSLACHLDQEIVKLRAFLLNSNQNVENVLLPRAGQTLLSYLWGNKKENRLGLCAMAYNDSPRRA